MTDASSGTRIGRRTLLAGAASLPLAGTLIAGAISGAQAQISGGRVSFAACGDSRPMMYLPYKEGHPDLVRMFVEMFGLVMPEKTAEEVVQKYVKMTFDHATKELIHVVMPFMTRSEVMTLSVDQGWVTGASVEDAKLLPGVNREIFRLQGGEWVARE